MTQYAKTTRDRAHRYGIYVIRCHGEVTVYVTQLRRSSGTDASDLIWKNSNTSRILVGHIVRHECSNRKRKLEQDEKNEEEVYGPGIDEFVYSKSVSYTHLQNKTIFCILP